MTYYYKDISEFIATMRCIRCNDPVDRIGAHCSECMTELQQEIDHDDRVDMLRKEPEQAWEFLNSEFQKIFKIK